MRQRLRSGALALMILAGAIAPTTSVFAQKPQTPQKPTAPVKSPKASKISGPPIPLSDYRRVVADARRVAQLKPIPSMEAKRVENALRRIQGVQLADGTIVQVDTSDFADAFSNAAAGSQSDKDIKALSEQMNGLAESVGSGGTLNSSGAKAGKLAIDILSAEEFARFREKDEKFDWQLPKAPQWLKNIGNWFARGTDKVLRAIGKFFRNLFGKLPRPKNMPGVGSLADTVLFVLYFLASVAATVGLYFLGKWLISRYGDKDGKRNTVRAGGADLTGEGIIDPLQSAHDAAVGGDYRSAIRLAYIASLRQLASTGLLTLEKNRTNWEYQRSLRARSRQGHELLLPATRLFDRIWYGKQQGTQADYEAIRRVHEGVSRLSAPSPESGPNPATGVPSVPSSKPDAAANRASSSVAIAPEDRL